MSNQARYNDPLWRQSFSAALTGLTIAASNRSALVETDADPIDGGGVAGEQLPGNAIERRADGSDDEDEVVAETFGWRVLLVREAMAIADTSISMIKGEPKEKSAPFKTPPPARPGPSELGRVMVTKTT